MPTMYTNPVSYAPELISSTDRTKAGSKFWKQRRSKNELDIEAFHKAFDTDLYREQIVSKDFFLPDGLFDLSNSAVTNLFEDRVKLDTLVKKYEASNATKPVYYALLAAIAVYGAQKGVHKKYNPLATFINLYGNTATAASQNQTAAKNQTASQTTATPQKTNTAASGVNTAVLTNYLWPSHVSDRDAILLCDKLAAAGSALRNTKEWDAIEKKLKKLWVCAVRTLGQSIRLAPGRWSTGLLPRAAAAFLRHLSWAYNNSTNGYSLTQAKLMPFGKHETELRELSDHLTKEIRNNTLDDVYNALTIEL